MVRLTDSRGRTVTISMWDALVPGVGRATIKRTSPPAPTPAPSNEKKEDAKEVNNKKEDEKHKKEDPKAEPTTEPAKDAAKKGADSKTDEWTPELDKQLMELKDAKKSWKEIVETMKKEKSILTNRYSTLMKEKSGDSNASGGKAENKSEKPPQSSPEKSAYELLLADMPGVFITEGALPGKHNRGEAATAPSLATVVEAAKQQPKVDMSWERRSGIVVTDDIFRAGDPGPIYDFSHSDEKVKLTIQELLFLGRMNDYFDEQKWLLLASRFWDRTHKQISPQTLRQLFAGEAGGK